MEQAMVLGAAPVTRWAMAASTLGSSPGRLYPSELKRHSAELRPPQHPGFEKQCRERGGPEGAW